MGNGDEEDEDGDEGSEEEDEEDEEDDEEEEEEEEILHPMQKRRMPLKWNGSCLLKCAARPLPPVSSLIVESISSLLADIVVDAVEGARQELNIPEEDAIPVYPSPFKQFFSPVGAEDNNGNVLWAAALDLEAEERTQDQEYRALSYSKLSASLAALVDNFSDAANIVHRDALSSYTAGRVSDVKSKAVLRITEDVRDKRVLVLLDMDVGKYISRDEYNEYNIPEDARPRELLEAAKFLKKILKENPTHLLVTTEISVPTAQYDDEEIPEVLNLSIKSLQPLLATLLRREVHFCPSVTALAETLLNVGPTAVILLDHTNAESMIPLPEPQESIESEDEEDRLPWLGDEKDDPAFKFRHRHNVLTLPKHLLLYRRLCVRFAGCLLRRQKVFVFFGRPICLQARWPETAS